MYAVQCAPAPLQEGIATGLESLGEDYYRSLATEYRKRREVIYRGLTQAGFKCARPAGAYYILADFTELSDLSDDEFAVWLTREVGVATVPGSSFYSSPGGGRNLIRFAFCKTTDILEAAAQPSLRERFLREARTAARLSHQKVRGARGAVWAVAA